LGNQKGFGIGVKIFIWNFYF